MDVSVCGCGDSDVLVLSCGDDGVMNVWDPATCAVTTSFKSASTLHHNTITSLSARRESWHHPVSHALLSITPDKPFVCVWHWGKDQPVLKCASPEKLCAMAATSDSGYLFAGGVSGKAYVWELSTGNLIGSWFAHYKSLCGITITADNTVMITAGEDAVLHSWAIPTVVSTLSYDPSSRITPLRSYSGHTLPVTCVRVGNSGSRFYSTSQDRVCRVWSQHRSDALTAIVCPSPLTVCCVDPLESTVYAGAADGNVYATNLHVTALHKTGAGSLSSTPSSSSSLQVYGGHSRAVSDVRVLPSGSVLLSSSEDGSVKVWDVASCQLLRSFDTHKVAVRGLLVLGKCDSWSGLSRKPSHSGHHTTTGNNASTLSGLAIAHLRKHAGQVDTSLVPFHVMTRQHTAVDDEPRLSYTSAFHVSVDAVPAPVGDAFASLDDDAGKMSDEHDTIARLREEIEKLRSENARWQAINTQLLSRLQPQPSQGQATVPPPPVSSSDNVEDTTGVETTTEAQEVRDTGTDTASKQDSKKKRRRK